MVMLEEPTFPGCLVTARPIGVFRMHDEHGPDAKVLTVPAHDPRFAGLQDLGDVPSHVAAEVGHFFDSDGSGDEVLRGEDVVAHKPVSTNCPPPLRPRPASSCLVTAIDCTKL